MSGLPAVQHGRILYVDEVLSQAAQLHGAAVRVLGQCAPRVSSAPRPACAHAPQLRRSLTTYDAASGVAVIVHHDCQLAVDTSLASPVVAYEARAETRFPFFPTLTRCDAQPSALLQFIGELDSRDGAGETRARPVLRARVARRVDGLDLALYEQALAVRRRVFEAQTQGVQS